MDRVLDIQFQSRSGAIKKLSALSMICFFTVFMMISIGLDRNFRDKFDFSNEISKFDISTNDIKFPVEVFDNYSYPDQIYYRVERTNRIVSNSDYSSFVDNQFRYQRQIEARIQDELIYDAPKRAELCGKLIDHCYGMVDLQDTNRLVMQTKIILINAKSYIPYVALVSYYIYYFDDKTEKLGLYGGYDADSLSAYYLQTQQNFVDFFSNYLSKKAGISTKIVADRFEKGDFADLFKQLPHNIRDSFNLNISSLIDKRLLTIHPISFDSVKRKGFISMGYPEALFPIFSETMLSNQKFNRANGH